jgi:hypothetical protein
MQCGVVVGLPLRARFIQRHTFRASGRTAISTSARGRIWRDSVGRTRTELVHRGAEGQEIASLIVICDPPAKATYFVDAASWTAIRKPLTEGEVSSRFDWLFPGQDVQDSGREIIEGVDCRKIRVADLEVALSDELGMVMSENVRSGDEEYSWRLFQIRRQEPDGKLFVVPAAFRVIIAGA